MKPAPTIITDRKEQNPFRFENLPSELGTLDTGDYSIKGLTHLVSVERKSLPDLLACVGRERDRFKRELQRLRAFRFRLLIIEATAAELEAGNWRSELTPAHVLGSLAAWAAQYRLPIWCGGDHEACGRFVERFLFQSARSIHLEWDAAGKFVEAAPAELTA